MERIDVSILGAIFPWHVILKKSKSCCQQSSWLISSC